MRYFIDIFQLNYFIGSNLELIRKYIEYFQLRKHHLRKTSSGCDKIIA